MKIIQEVKNPEILVVTPLLPGHKVSGITKKTLKRNKVPFYWIASEGNQNIPKNALEGILWYKKKYGKLPYYYMMVDRDIEAGRGLLDRLYERLENTPLNVGFSYATFQFKGHVNADFPAMPYDINRLIQSNYISSNSMFLSSVIEGVGLVTDDKYKRLLDWAFLLKCYKHGYVGMPVPKAWFIAHSTENDISAGSFDDYKVKFERVRQDFILPLLNRG
jgi:hypothetical protein